jgi:hypothetical protein
LEKILVFVANRSQIRGLGLVEFTTIYDAAMGAAAYKEGLG